MVVTGRLALGALFGAVVVGLLIPSVVGVLAVLGILVAAALLDARAAGSVRTLRFERTGDSSVRLGTSAQVSLRVTNPGSRRVRGWLRDAWVPSAGVHADRVPLDLHAGQSRVVTTTLTPTRRGDRHPDRVTVRSLGPIGLAGRQGGHRVPWRLRALPPFESRRHLPARLARLRELDGRTALMVRGAGTEFDSLREYVVGDDTRSIDWRATARSTEVVVRTWRPERDRHVLIVLDTGRTSAGRVGDAPKLDASMDAALLLAAVAGRAGDRVDLLAYDRAVRADLERPSPAELLPRMVDALATVQPELLETDHRGLVAEVVRRAGRHSLVVLLTDLDSASVGDGLVPALPTLLHRHTLLVASVHDPELTRLTAARFGAAEVYGAAAAEQDRRLRAEMAERLRRRRVHIVDAAPDELAPQVADAYLDLKARGVL